MPFICSCCQQEFSTKNSRDHHSRTCQKSFKVDYPNGPIVVTPDADGKLTCHCSHSKCPKSFSTFGGLTKHVKKTGLPWVGSQEVSLDHISLIGSLKHQQAQNDASEPRAASIVINVEAPITVEQDEAPPVEAYDVELQEETSLVQSEVTHCFSGSFKLM